MPPWDRYAQPAPAGPWAKYQQTEPPEAVPVPPQQPTANTMADSQARGLPPLEMPNAFGIMKPAPVKAPPLSQQWQEAKGAVGSMAKGVGVGAAAGVPGMPGDIESLGRLALSPLGVSRETTLPTSERVGNWIAGKPSNEIEADSRLGGGLLSPLAYTKLAKLAGKAGGAVGNVALRGSGTLPAATAAHEAGYSLPPNMAQQNPSLLSRGLSGWGGKVKIQQAASEKNQAVTTQLAARELGIDPKTPLTDRAFAAVRERAGKAYEAVKAIPEPLLADDEFTAAISQLGERTSSAAEHFPGIVKNQQIDDLASGLSQAQSFPAKAAIEVVKKLRHDATTHLRSMDDPAKAALGQAQRHAADALDDLIERNLARMEQSQPWNQSLWDQRLVQNYREARQLIAKSHDVEAATNTATGEVSARALARLGGKKPLTGGLSQIANAGEAFPKAMQDASAFGGTESHSVLDMVLAAGSAGMGRLDLAGAIAGRPIARASVLSKPYQNLAIGGKAATVPGSSIAAGIDPKLLMMLSPQVLAQLLAAQTPARQ